MWGGNRFRTGWVSEKDAMREEPRFRRFFFRVVCFFVCLFVCFVEIYLLTPPPRGFLLLLPFWTCSTPLYICFIAMHCIDNLFRILFKIFDFFVNNYLNMVYLQRPVVYSFPLHLRSDHFFEIRSLFQLFSKFGRKIVVFQKLSDLDKWLILSLNL